MMSITTLNEKITYHELPDKCPHCHRSITPIVLYGHIANGKGELFVYCPDKSCKKSFIGYYVVHPSGWHFNNKVSQGTLTGREFSKIIQEISSSFVIIYNQAFAAEQQSLLEICGVGYRKALEFLIKDYLIQNQPSEKESIERKLLGSCISDYVSDDRIKSVAKRAAWLGNDQTHFVKKWEGKDLQDLKKLINLTVHWIEMEALTNSFENEMPD